MATNPTNYNKLRAGRLGRAGLVAALLALAIALAGCGSSSSKSSAPQSHAAAVGHAPPEWAANADAWPAHNYNLSNTRATTQTPINSKTVSNLKVKWRYTFTGAGGFGAFSSTPLVLHGTVYLQDLSSNVIALNSSTGKVKWRHAFNRPDAGPNGIAYGYGRIYGATESIAFALDAQSGKLIWSKKLVRNKNEGIDMTPQLYDNTVVFSTVPGNISSFYAGNGDGIVWALDAASGKTKWKFNTISDGAKLFGNPKINSGGGLWYPPAVDGKGRIFISIANPAPLYGTPKYPNGSSRPGPDLYTNSLVALDGQTGKMLWHQQVVPHDVRDYDLMIPPIVANVPIQGVQTEIVMVAGKMGKAYAFRADNGDHLWTLAVGKHENDIGPLPKKLVTVFPGDLGGVETPMAFADNLLFVPWLNFPTIARASGLPGGIAGTLEGLNKGTGGLTAVDAASGKVAWQQKLPSENFGAATVANDVVFTSDYAGTIYAFDTKTGKTLWTKKASAGINSFPAIDGDTLLVGAAAPGFAKNPEFELIAYSLSGTGAASAPAQQAPATPTTPAPTTSPAGAIQVNGGEFFFRLSTNSAAKPGKLTFAFKNIGHVEHDFKINGKQTPLIEPGQTSKLVVTFSKTGKYPYLCTVPGHAEAGMKGVFTVR
jgi:outer membrane protein assembly factor BamB